MGEANFYYFTCLKLSCIYVAAFPEYRHHDRNGHCTR